MKRISLLKILLLSLLFLGMISAGTALASANFVPATHIDAYISPPITPNDLKPAECASLDLDNGHYWQREASMGKNFSMNLILGSSGPDG